MRIIPIAYFHSPLTSKFGIPRQSGLVQNLPGRIVFTPPFRHAEAVRGLEYFDYLWLIWEFSANNLHSSTEQDASHSAQHLTVRPPRLGGNERVGVFATRSPYRPNPIGLTSVKLLRVEEKNGALELVVSGADLLNGTPIYDIKPYLSYSDSHPDAKNGFADAVKEHRLEVDWGEFAEVQRLGSVSHASCMPMEIFRDLTEILSQDPRPAYQDDPNREYKLDYAGYNITFSVQNLTLFVKNITFSNKK